MKLFLILLFISFITLTNAQDNVLKRSILWDKKSIIEDNLNNVNKFIINFPNAVYFDNSTLFPYYYERIKLDNNYKNIDVKVKNLNFISLKDDNISKIDNLQNIPKEIIYTYEINFERKIPYLEIKLIPLININGEIKKLISFEIEYNLKSPKNINITHQFAQNSVLGDGSWVKIKTNENGIYKLTYSDLTQLGFSNPKNIRIYGNGNGMLPERNSDLFIDDLIENSIKIVKGTDGIFNEGDYILFYGESPVKWKYDSISNKFKHTMNLYADYTYYFITSDENNSKEIQTENSSSLSPNNIISVFNDYTYHEEQKYNLIKSGQLWVGEHFNIVNNYSFNFSFPNLSSNPVLISTNLLSRNPINTYGVFTIKANNQNIQNVSISAVDVSNNLAEFAKIEQSNVSFISTLDNLNIGISYSKPTQTSEGWLDYIEINAKRNLIMSGGQMHFRSTESIGNGKISKFELNINGHNNIIIWDITDKLNIKEVSTILSGNILSFTLPTDSLLEFIAFDGSSFLKPQIVGQIANQNLHSLSQPDLIIVTHPDFLASANELANIHREIDSLRVVVVTNEQVYNEFSSGAPDVTAIKNFAKMFYSRGTNNNDIPDYLLLFGDGSYDNKTISSSNNNFILTYESENSLNHTSSSVTDDYFGLLDDNEGANLSGILDIGIGRLPVRSVYEAQVAVNKIKKYIGNNSMGSWRNVVCFVGDDEDSNTHMGNSENLANYIDTIYPVYNIDKIYLDAYKQITSPNGDKYPDATLALNNRFNKGALVINYIGHGGINQLSHEQLITISDILSWNNINNMPFFFTATCEFSKFDDYEQVPAGVQAFLNPNGGCIGLFSTTRLVYASQNQSLDLAFFKYVFEKNTDNEYYRLGDLMRISKNIAGGSLNTRNFILLADPALKLNYPKYNINTEKINDSLVTSTPDTLKALSKVTISGYITDNYGAKIKNFNGTIYPIVYDKQKNDTTLGNDGFRGFGYVSQNSILYKGKASVINGRFAFTFIVPKDILYNYGIGKISYYSNRQINNPNEQIDDANGYYNNIIIGGSSNNALNDNQSPDIQLFMNDNKFVYGGITDENPKMLAYVIDSSGINTVGNGIGHDITVVLDNNTNRTIVLNDYYESDIDKYQSGKIEYPFSKLTTGVHNLKLKVWDVNNNSSEEYIEFVVAKYSELSIDHLLNYPNPFTTNTSFYFDHNQPNTNLDVIIQIFTVTGKLIKTLDTQISSSGYRSTPIKWDGRDDYGDKIGKGVYIYRIKVRSPNGNIVNKFEKLVILQ